MFASFFFKNGCGKQKGKNEIEIRYNVEAFLNLQQECRVVLEYDEKGKKKAMKIIIVRHAEPDYEIDSLTEKGWREAELLSKRLAKLDIDQIFGSPLGRAKDTCSFTEKVIGKKAVEKEWLREFLSHKHEDMVLAGERPAVWDQIPNEWTMDSRYFNEKEWHQTPYMKKWKVEEENKWVASEFDNLLKEYGYEREGHYYRVRKANEKTIVLFCHFGLEVILLSHLMSVSPMILWHGFCAAPSSVTIINSEERREGIASFRASQIGDISHLYVAEEEPSFAARFCEMYQNIDQRHD